MRILVAHNRYRERGGEDVVVEQEVELLRGAGHEVIEYFRHNDEIDETAPLGAAVEALWSARASREVGQLIRDRQPDVVHVHNTFAQLSPSVFWAASRAGVPTVQTLHNFRLICPQGSLLRQGRVCDDCSGRAPLPALRHACYRNSRPQTAVLSSMLLLHRAMGTWAHQVTRHIALSEHSRGRFIRAGFPASRLVVKPNFVRGPAEINQSGRSGLLFVGRLSSEKGIDLLGQAAVGLPPASLRVAGTGPARPALGSSPALSLLGHLPSEKVGREMSRALGLVLPSLALENCPMSLLEAFAHATPVIGSRIGAIAEMVEDGVTGILVEPGDVSAWQSAMRFALSHPQQMARMGEQARRRWEQRYQPESNLRQLLTIYGSALAEARALQQASKWGDKVA